MPCLVINIAWSAPYEDCSFILPRCGKEKNTDFLHDYPTDYGCRTKEHFETIRHVNSGSGCSSLTHMYAFNSDMQLNENDVFYNETMYLLSVQSWLSLLVVRGMCEKVYCLENFFPDAVKMRLFLIPMEMSILVLHRNRILYSIETEFKASSWP